VSFSVSEEELFISALHRREAFHKGAVFSIGCFGRLIETRGSIVDHAMSRRTF
jgi:3-dehydroquinate dehydratase